MNLDAAAATLTDLVLQALPRRLKKQLADDADLKSALAAAMSAAHQQPGQPLPSEFYRNADLAAEIATFMQTGQLDHAEWDAIYEESQDQDGAVATPAPTLFQSSLGQHLSGMGLDSVGFPVTSAPPSIESGSIHGYNVVAGTQIIVNGAERGDEHATENLRGAYLNRLVQQLGRISLAGIDPKVTTDDHAHLALNDIYVHLKVSSAETDANHQVRSHFSGSAVFFAAQNRLSVILGEPGGGKSTFVNFFALCMAGENLDSEAFNASLILPGHTHALHGPLNRRQRTLEQWSHGALLPVRVVLRDFATYCYHEETAPNSEVLWNFLRQDLRSVSLEGFVDSMRVELLSTGGVVFFDGLDEVPENQDQREQIVECIEQFSATFSRCRIVVTSRTYAYRLQGWRLEGFSEATIQDLDMPRISTFVQCWYREVAKRRGTLAAQYEPRALELQSAIASSPNLLELARRPLLLTLMASLHAWRGGSLPERREELYADAVELLLDTWESQRTETLPDGRSIQLQPSLLEWLQTDREGVRDLLNRLAFGVHLESEGGERETADISEETLISGLTRLSGNPNARPLRLIEYLSQRAGIVVQRAAGVYAFPHRTFQEYLAACYLTDEDYPDRLVQLFVGNPSHWREVALLAIAKASRGTSYAGVFTAHAACPEGTDVTEGAAQVNGTILAGYALLEAGPARLNPRSAALMDRVQSGLLSVMRSSTTEPYIRIDSGQILGKLGDPRPEVTKVTSAIYSYVPAGSFVWHDEFEEIVELDDDQEERNWKRRRSEEIELGYHYWISKHPVSASQFIEFVEAGGYEEARFWTEAAAAGHYQDGWLLQVDVERFDDTLQEHELPSSSFWRFGPNERLGSGKSPNRPATRVSIYEAVAYCRWLTEQFGGAFVVTLPSEAEWEKAARGGHLIPEPVISMTFAELKEGGPAGNDVNLVVNQDPTRQFPWIGAEISGDRVFCDLGAEKLGAAEVDGLPLGLHPAGASPYGAQDMLANVWQHTRTLRTDRARSAEVPPPLLFDGASSGDVPTSWATKGCGSWMECESIRIAHRLHARANEAFVAGFRVVLLDGDVDNNGVP